MNTIYITVIIIVLSGVMLLIRKWIKKNKKKMQKTLSLTSEQIRNAKTIVKDLMKEGFVNPFLIAGILAITYKESFLIPKTEKGYSNTSNTRIKNIFSKTKNLSDIELNELKKDETKFFDFVYGGKYGNDNTGDGYKYRGRGFNQITFKNAYDNLGKKIGVDLLKNPDLLNDVNVASKVLVKYFEEVGKQAVKKGMNINDVRNVKDGFEIALQMNAGLKTNTGTNFFQSVRAEYFPYTETFLKLV